MALLKGNASTITIPVKAAFTRDGVDREVAFTVAFKRRTREEQIAQAEYIDAEDLDGFARASTRLARSKEILRQIITGWRDLRGADGEEIPFSLEVLDEMLADDDYYDALVTGLTESTLPKARRKN